MRKQLLFITLFFGFTFQLFTQNTPGLTIREGLVTMDEHNLIICAEIENTTDDTYFWPVRMLVYLYDANGKQIEVDRIDIFGNSPASDVCTIETDMLPPRCKSPVRRVRDIKKIKGKVASHRIEVHGSKTKHAKMANITNIKVEEQPYAYKISGEYHCVTGDCHNPGFVVAAYDANGKILLSRCYNVSKTEHIRALSQGDKHVFTSRTFAPYGIDFKDIATIGVYPQITPVSSYD